MVPVVLGWVYVGTQTSAGSVKVALTEATVPALGPYRIKNGDCCGIKDRTYFDRPDQNQSGDIMMRKPSRDSHLSTITTLRSFEEPIERPVKTFMGFSIAGDELEPGPIFNYARPWTHANAVKHIADAFKHLTIRQLMEEPVARDQEWDPDPDNWKGNLQGSPEEYSRYINAEGEDVPDYSIHAPASADLIFNCVIAAFVAVFLQWGTTGAAIVIAYE